jgi:hypothetical protein
VALQTQDRILDQTANTGKSESGSSIMITLLVRHRDHENVIMKCYTTDVIMR